MDLSSYVRDQAISALLQAGNYKQAVKNIDKKLKKTPKDKSLIVLKSYALFEAGELAESAKICSTLVAKDADSVTDPDLLSLLYYTLCGLSKTRGQDELKLGESVWQNAIKISKERVPKLSIAQRWASEALEHQQWAHLVKAANALSKIPDNGSSVAARSYYFWQALGCHLVSQTSTENSLIADTNGKISVKMLMDALQKIPDSPDAFDKPGQWISTLSEFNLLYYVLIEHNKVSDVQDMLDSRPAKQVLRDDIEIVCFKFHAMVNLLPKQEWKWSCVHNLIEIAIKHDYDWIIEDLNPWNVLLEMCQSNLHESRWQDFEELLHKIPVQATNSRSVRYIKHQLHEAKSAAKAPNGTASTTPVTQHIDETASAKYFKEMRDRTYVLDDIRQDILNMSKTQFASFRSDVQQSHAWGDFSKELLSSEQLKWLAYETNVMTADLIYLQSRASIDSSEDGLLKALRSLVCNCLRLYRLSKQHTAEIVKKDTGPGDDACRIAAVGLIGLGKLTGDNACFVQAACILAYLLEDSPYNFRARLVYIELLQHHNAISLAWKAWKFLEVKEILHEDLGPKFFTRICTSHPSATSSLDVQTALVDPISFYQSAVSKLPTFQEMALEHGNYEQLARLVKFAQRLQTSNARTVYLSERRRIARLRGSPYDKHDSSPNFQFPSTNFEEQAKENDVIFRVNNGPSLTTVYADFLIILDKVYDMVYSSQKFTVEMAKTTLGHWKHLDARHEELSTALSTQENEIFASLLAIIEISDELCSSTKPDPSKLDVELKKIKDCIQKSDDLEKLEKHQNKDFILGSLATWELFHPIILRLELLQGYHRLATRILEQIKNKFGKTTADATRSLIISAKDIQNLAKDQAEKYKTVASSCRNSLSGLINDDRLTKGIFGPDDGAQGAISHEIYQTMGSQNMKRLLEIMARNIVESFDSTLSIKI